MSQLSKILQNYLTATGLPFTVSDVRMSEPKSNLGLQISFDEAYGNFYFRHDRQWCLFAQSMGTPGFYPLKPLDVVIEGRRPLEVRTDREKACLTRWQVEALFGWDVKTVGRHAGSAVTRNCPAIIAATSDGAWNIAVG